MNELDDLVKKIEENYIKKIELLKKLNRAIKIKNFLPRAFNDGPCTITDSGNVEYNPAGIMIIFHLASGETVEFSIKSVPYDVWPLGLQKQFTDYEKKRGKSLGNKYKVLRETAGN